MCAIGAQIVLAHLLINLFDVNYVWFALWLAVAAHIVIEIASISSLDRTHGFKLFILTYLVGELYLFAVALLGSFYEFGIMGLYTPVAFLHSNAANVMFCLSVLSLVTDTFTHLLRWTGGAGEFIGRLIDRTYSSVMRLPIYQKGA